MISNNKLNINDYIRILEWYKVASKQDCEINVAGIHAETKRKIKD
ncbi:MAG: hypothetical protein ACXADY_02810 [Candidatus Hodarchaeales archaeon]|jgi:hypothetical protein